MLLHISGHVRRKLLIKALSQNIQFFHLKIVVLPKKEGQKLSVHFRKFGGGEQKHSMTNLKHKHLATWLLYTPISEFPWKRYDCSMLPHLTSRQRGLGRGGLVESVLKKVNLRQKFLFK